MKVDKMTKIFVIENDFSWNKAASEMNDCMTVKNQN